MHLPKLPILIVLLSFATLILALPVDTGTYPSVTQSPSELLSQKLKDIYGRMLTAVRAGISRGRVL